MDAVIGCARHLDPAPDAHRAWRAPSSVHEHGPYDMNSSSPFLPP